MSELLEIVGDDIARLNDADLRMLIGLLCEADYRQAGLPTRGITWGGNQDARDGGLMWLFEKRRHRQFIVQYRGMSRAFRSKKPICLGLRLSKKCGQRVCFDRKFGRSFSCKALT